MVEGTTLGSLHARLDEAEPGLFKAVYVEETDDRGADAVSIPDSHIGTSRDGVRMWVEQMAAQMGYRDEIWDSLTTTPAQTAPAPPPARRHNRRRCRCATPATLLRSGVARARTLPTRPRSRSSAASVTANERDSHGSHTTGASIGPAFVPPMGEIDPSFVITHRVSLEDGPEMYKAFRDKKDGCIKGVMKP